MTFAWAVPTTMPFVGLQPLDIEAKFVNGNDSAAIAVGDLVTVDLRAAEATNAAPGPGGQGSTGSIWSTVINNATAANQQAEGWIITAVYLRKENGKAESLAAGDTGVFKICGRCPVKITNPDASAITAPRPFAMSLAATNSGVTNGTTTRIPANRRIYGFSIGNIAASEAGTILTDSFFCGFGIGTAIEDAV